MYLKTLALALLLMITSGCVHVPVDIPIDRVAERLHEEFKPLGLPEPLACNPCGVQWGRAQTWLSRHSRLKLQIATDVTLQTYNPTDVVYGFSIVKEPLADGGGIITIDLFCGRNSYLVCSPWPNDVKLAFYWYVKTGDDRLLGYKALRSLN